MTSSKLTSSSEDFPWDWKFSGDERRKGSLIPMAHKIEPHLMFTTTRILKNTLIFDIFSYGKIIDYVNWHVLHSYGWNHTCAQGDPTGEFFTTPTQRVWKNGRKGRLPETANNRQFQQVSSNYVWRCKPKIVGWNLLKLAVIGCFW